jgi:hypothetical protein
MHSFVLIPLVFLFVFCLTGCALFKVRKDVKISKDSSLLFCEVISKSPIKKPVAVVAYSNSYLIVKIADYTVLSEPGQYEMVANERN